MRTLPAPAPARPGPLRSKRILALAGDDRLVEQVRGGSEAAFEVVFERYGKGILSFCRHMLGSQEEAEDAVQHTFASAYGDLQRGGEREVRLKPWLYTIARNRCLSMLRARRDELHISSEPATAGLAEQVEQRAELRQLLADIRHLPAEQRAALLLAEVADLSHADIARVLDCEVARVKALVFRARNFLIVRRDARETPCSEIREQLAVLSGGSLRRSGLKQHLNACPGCRAYRDELRRQRSLLAVALPVTPSLLLRSKVLGGGGLGGGAAGGASVVAASAGAGAAAPVGSAVLAKVAVLAVLAGGGAVATQAALDKGESPGRGSSAPASAPGAPRSGSAQPGGTVAPGDVPAAHARGRPGDAGRSRAKAGHKAHGTKGGRGPAEVPGSRGRGVEHRSSHAGGVPHGRGAPTAPPSHTPVKRGRVNTSHPAKPAKPAPSHERTTHTPPPPPPTAHGGTKATTDAG